MDDMIETSGREVTPDVLEAREVHAEIMASKKTVALGIYELARGLKRMRDDELYKELGFDDFRDYCEKMAKVNASQAYKYIRTYESLGDAALQSAGSLGIEKLFLVTQLPPEERSDALGEPGKIEGMSVKELREFVAKARQWGDQLTFLEHELEASDDDRREAEEKLEEVTKKLAAVEEESQRKLSNQYSAMNSQLEELKAEHARKISEMKIEHAKACASIVAEQADKRPVRHAADDELRAAREEGRKAGKREGEEELEKQKKAFEELQKQLSGVNSGESPTRESDIESVFEFYLAQMKVVFENLEDALFEGSCGYDLNRAERDKWTGEIFAKMHNFIRDTSKRNSETEVTERDIEEYKKRGSR